ncbi:hypothetical protein ATANTOWER_014251 [Ataeniobius toweri]|uniref:Uncharacterized protein n=1 Tax=Ataeniobius toweri TaxID=208326 RepID=A0ABU7BCK1_9TELE|nr:hypothetical protein [Ataeniobius toweri]
MFRQPSEREMLELSSPSVSDPLHPSTDCRQRTSALRDAVNKFDTMLKSSETSCIQPWCLQVLLGQISLVTHKCFDFASYLTVPEFNEL